MIYYLVEYHKVRITLCFDSTDSFEKLSREIAGFPHTPIAEPVGRIIKIKQKKNSWKIKDEYFYLSKRCKSINKLSHQLSQLIMRHISDLAREHFCLHAGSVAYGDKGIIMPAVSGSGKTTTTCWFVKQGLDYVSDEFVMIDEDSFINGVSRPMQVKSPYGTKIINSMLDTDKHLLQKTRTVSYSPELFNNSYGYSDKLKLHCILFPKYSPTAGNTISVVNPSERGFQLMGNFVNSRNFPDFGFKELLKATDVPSYRLDYSDITSLSLDWVKKELLL